MTDVDARSSVGAPRASAATRQMRRAPRIGPPFICALVGGCLCRLALTGAHRRYVRPGLALYLVASGALLIVAAAFTWWRGRSALAGDHDDDHHDHDDGHRPSRVGWLLVAPVAVLFVVAPPALGSFALSRSMATVSPGGGSFTDLHGPGPVEMLVKEFDERAFDRGGVSFAGVPVRMIGFVARDDGEGFLIARFQIACCAADGRANAARILGFSGPAPSTDAWVEVIGRFEAGAGDQEAPRLRVESVRPVAIPDDPYEPN